MKQKRNNTNKIAIETTGEENKLMEKKLLHSQIMAA